MELLMFVWVSFQEDMNINSGFDDCKSELVLMLDPGPIQ